MGDDRRDVELVASYRREGAPADFEALVHRHRESVLRLVLSVLGPELQADAEDVVQLAFLRAHDRLGSFRGHARFGTWLYRIAHNLSQDHARTRRRRQRLLYEQARRAGEAQPGGIASEGASVGGDSLEERERALAVQRALSQVSDPHRTALRLHYWFDQLVAEIAGAMGVPVGTAKSYLHRGRSRLHRVLTTEGWRP